MATTGLAGFLTRVRGERADDIRSDADLLREYIASRSDTAFTELVRRFAPMVWGVCRRTVGHRQHAEDAFQAVFGVLVRKPGSIHPPSAIGGWLHAVALRTSLRARAMAERQSRRECPSADIPDRAAPDGPEPVDPDLVRMLDEEIARLPEKLSTAVALCELAGLSRSDAAKQLGIAEGTLSSRLAAARRQLATRLRSRGVALGMGSIAVSLGVGAAAAAPRVSPIVSEHVSDLVDGVIRTMFLRKLKLLTVGAVAAVAAVALLGGVLAATGGEPGAPPQPPVPVALRIAPTPKTLVREGTILLWLDEKPQLLKPDGSEQESPDPIPKVQFGTGSGNAQLSPDGTKVAFAMAGAEFKPKVAPAPAGVPFLSQRTTLKVLELKGKKETTTLDTVHVNGFHWLGDGKTLYVRGNEIGAGEEASADLVSWVYDPATAKRAPLKVPAEFVVRSIGPDSKTAVVDEWKMTPNTWHQRAHLWTVGTDKPTPLLELNHALHSPTPKFSPDCKRLLCRVLHYGSRKPLGNGAFNLEDFKFNNVVVIDLATKKQTIVKELGEAPEWSLCGLAWSPDGKKIAYAETKRLPRPVGAPRAPMAQHPFRVIIADSDGKNAKEIYNAVGNWLVGFDWK